MIGTLPEVLDIRLLGTCNLRCPFCFGPPHAVRPGPLDSFIELLGKLPALGVRAVVFTGGEPTLVPGLPAILETAKRAGLNTVLSTNGTALGASLEAIAPWLDWVGLPLDADRPERNARMRVGARRHFHTVLELISRIRSEHPRLRIKVGTVVCAINREWVVGLADVLAGSHAPDVWKLYQVEQAGYARAEWSRLALGDVEFGSILQRAADAASSRGVNVVSYWRSERTGKYLFVEPNGDAMSVDGSQETVIGNFFTGLPSVLEGWQEHVSAERLVRNFESTYPGLEPYA